MLRYFFVSIIGLLVLSSCSKNIHQPKSKPHIVFISGEEEYRSEESLPMLAEIMKRDFGAKVSFCFSTDSLGYINPNQTNHISNLEALKTADLAVFFCRFRALPDNELKLIEDYVNSGRPIMGFRTSTHTFLYKDKPTHQKYNDEWPTNIFGQQWITHHGHFDDGDKPLTEVIITSPKNIITTGIEPFKAYSWLYHVDGGKWKLNGDATPLIHGTSLKSQHEMDNKTDEFGLTQPVAWTKTFTGSEGKSARVFFTTLGHPYDFKNVNMRRLSINGMLWAMGMENKINQKINADPVNIYNPNNSGFGSKFKQNVKTFKNL
jgi:type 1 glutamine amidotransferase